jgi:hypothetical protein
MFPIEKIAITDKNGKATPNASLGFPDAPVADDSYF